MIVGMKLDQSTVGGLLKCVFFIKFLVPIRSSPVVKIRTVIVPCQVELNEVSEHISLDWVKLEWCSSICDKGCQCMNEVD